MPKQTEGFNDQGESQWFNGNRLPEGWGYTDPTLKVQEEPEELEPDPREENADKETIPAQESEIIIGEMIAGDPSVTRPETVPDTPDIAPRAIKRRSRKRN